MTKLNMAYFSSSKNRAKLLLSSLPVSPSRVLRASGTSPYHLMPKTFRATWTRPEKTHLLSEVCSPDGTDNRQQIKFLYGSISRTFWGSAQRNDDFQLIRITCQAACHGKTVHGLFVEFKKLKKIAVVLNAGVTFSGIPCIRHITVPFGAEAQLGYVAQA